MKRFVILGGGYGGITIAQHLLEKHIPDNVSIVLIDRLPFQGLKTEFYALAAGTAADTELRVQYPVDARLLVTYGEVGGIDLGARQIQLIGQDPLAYDWLAIALGCTDRYHGIPGAELFSNSIQTFDSTRKTYQQLCGVKPYGSVTVVGGGLSGVEVAAELRESRPDLNISILDRGPGILSQFPGRLQHYVSAWFHEHQVNMLGNISISKLEQGVVYNGPQEIATDATVWTAGIQPVPIVQKLNLPKDSQGRLIINEYHQLPDYPEVYAVGDCASLRFSPSAQAAEAQGKQIAEVMEAIWKGATPKLGKIKLKGVLGSLGKKAGFGLMGKTSIMGRVPRMLKSGVLWMSKRHFG